MIVPSNKTTWEQRLLRLAQDALCFSGAGAQPAVGIERAQALRETYRACEVITAQNSRSFSLATSLLPGEKRRAMRALYALCRTADDLADGEAMQPELRLYQLRKGITARQPNNVDPVLAAWADISYRYQIPVCYAEQLLDGVACDLVRQRYDTFEDLSVYCYNVASTVGIMSMYITGFSGQCAVPYAIKLGVALQLTNILRDVGEDWSVGRLYLPLEELRAFGLTEADLALGVVDERWRAMMRFQIARARCLYTEAMPGIAFLHPDGRFAVAAAASLYQSILDDIEQHDYDVFSRRAYANRKRKSKALLRALWAALKSCWQKPAELSIYQEETYDF